MAEFTVYPNAIDSNSTLPKSTDNVTPVRAEVTNRLREAIIAIESELGLQPSGTFTTVRARLDALELGTGGGGGAGGTIGEVRDEGILVDTNVTSLNFRGPVVTAFQTAPGKVDIFVTGSVGGGDIVQVQETKTVSSDGQTIFALSFSPQDETAVKLYVNGFKQEHGVDYTVSGTVVTYSGSFTLLTTDIVEFWYIADASTALVTQIQETIAVTVPGQTLFTLSDSPIDTDAVEMYINGQKQQHGTGNDYTVAVDIATYSGSLTLGVSDIVEFWYITDGVGTGGGGGGGENLAETLAIGNTTGGSNISMTDGDDIRAADGYLDLNVLSTGANPALVRFQEDGTDFLTFNPAASVDMLIGESFGDFTIAYASRQTILDTDGAAVTINAQAGNGTGDGGAVAINGGAGGAGGAGGDSALGGGAPGTDGKGGDVGMLAAAGDGTGAGGNVIIGAGNSGSGATGDGGIVNIVAGSPLSTNGNGGALTIATGPGVGTGDGGAINILAGDSGDGDSGQVGGTITISAGNQDGTGEIGGDIDINAGGAESGTGGNVTIDSGNGNAAGDISVSAGGGSGSDGNINFTLTTGGGTTGTISILQNSTTMLFFDPVGPFHVVFEKDFASPAIAQETQTTALTNGETLSVVAQNSTTGDGGALTLAAGSSISGSDTDGGVVSLLGGGGRDTGLGGNVFLKAGNTGVDGYGGNVIFAPGSAGGSGKAGNFVFAFASAPDATAGEFQDMAVGMFIENADSIPTGNPVDGGFLYVESGAGKWRGTSGTITTFGPAEPHCEKCGRDFALQWESNKYGKLTACMWCLTDALESAGINLDKFVKKESV